MKKTINIALLLIITTMAYGQANLKPELSNDNSKLEWFKQAKLGIFIHWGIYSVKGIGESWSFYQNEISYPDYMKQAEGFTAKNYNPDEWAKLFKEAGARYVVLTTKHHDGFALWDTKQGDLSAVKKSPAGRDLVGPYCNALRKLDLKVGLYFSHLDWSHPDYASVRPLKQKNDDGLNPFGFPAKGKEDTVKWERFLKFHRGQLKELAENYKPDLFWFDGDWERDDAQWKFKELRQQLLSWQPNVILNSRMGSYGDYATPEQGIPVVAPKGPWELCMTTNDSWGYQGKDNNYKSIDYIIRIFSECIGAGGNLLLDIGPKADGTIDGPQVSILKSLGRWTKKHEEAIFTTNSGLPAGHFYGPTTLSKDKKTVYLFLFDIPKSDVIVKGIRNNIKSVRVIGSNQELTWKRNGGAAWHNIPGVMLIIVPQNVLDSNVTVIAIDLDSELDLYHN